MSKKIFGVTSLILIIFIASSFIFLEKSLSGRLFRWGISLDLSNFKLLSFSKDKTRVSRVEKLEVVSGTTKVLSDKTEIEDHKKYIEDRKFLLESLFLPTTSPYPEVITNIIECPDEFKPKVRNVDNGTVYTLFAGERFNYGVCAKDLVKYNSEYAIFNCKEKGIFEIRIFSTDNKKIKETMESFKC